MKQPAKFNTILGYAPGNVPAYSSHYASADEREFPNRKSYRSYLDGVFMGYKWQCVEFARRWLYVNHGVVFDNIPMAYDIFRLRTLRSIKDHRLLPLRSFRNGAKRLPVSGCMLIWQEGGEFEETGHVAIVTEVFNDRIRIVEQNVGHTLWPDGQNYARELPAHLDEDGGYHIDCSFNDAAILGWVVQTDDSTYAENFSPPDATLFNLKTAQLAHPARHVTAQQMKTADERAYFQAVGDYILTRNSDYQNRYLRMSHSALCEIRHASNELHAMFMHATDHVLENDDLLARFGFPPKLWPRLRKSWNNRRNHLITGRMDFSVSEKGIKLYEYNADSASCYMECGSVQGRWAKLNECDDGWDAGHHLHEALVHAWKKSDIPGVLHILQDNDLEETYHALYMKAAMEEAGITVKVVHGLNKLFWNEQGQVVDADGERILWVWKTWAWETALDQLRAECEEDEQPQLPSRNESEQRKQPRLVDVLLTPDVKVFEPLWSLVPSNKAILPIVYELYPDYPCLLNTLFELTPELENNGYAIKPIVGRCGANISIIDKNNQVIEETAGKFDQRDLIYQELFPLPKEETFHLQVSTFIVDGRYAGACVRADESPIISGQSEILPLRIVEDDDLL